MSDANGPEFFKVFLPQHSSERLKIPIEFVQHLGGTTSGSVLLTGPSGNPWKVELFQKEDGLFFDKGWPTFVRDHLIDVGEFLVFRYDGNLRFTVTIFDHSACEKESAFYANCSQPIDINIKQEGDNRKRVESSTPSIEVLGDSPKKVRGNSPTKACNERHGLSEGDEQRAAKSFTTNHPFFVVRMQKYNVHKSGLLHLPLTFLKDHLLRYKNNEKIVLRNQKGESWLVKVILAGTGYCFSAGMISFVRDNNIKEGDICIFELVDKHEIHVHFNRENIEL